VQTDRKNLLNYIFTCSESVQVTDLEFSKKQKIDFMKKLAELKLSCETYCRKPILNFEEKRKANSILGEMETLIRQSVVLSHSDIQVYASFMQLRQTLATKILQNK